LTKTFEHGEPLPGDIIGLVEGWDALVDRRYWKFDGELLIMFRRFQVIPDSQSQWASDPKVIEWNMSSEQVHPVSLLTDAGWTSRP
jgi:hypothetical protein